MKTLINFLEKTAQMYPNRIAVSVNNEHITYANLYEKSYLKGLSIHTKALVDLLNGELKHSI